MSCVALTNLQAFSSLYLFPEFLKTLDNQQFLSVRSRCSCITFYSLTLEHHSVKGEAPRVLSGLYTRLSRAHWPENTHLLPIIDNRQCNAHLGGLQSPFAQRLKTSTRFQNTLHPRIPEQALLSKICIFEETLAASLFASKSSEVRI